ncbi:MAG TPA: cysteine-rich CWC family protein [Rhodocyclaceae bacterium]|nr:cysteine-rich CWC family protein [Rhodocyclaceae bacterium]
MTSDLTHDKKPRSKTCPRCGRAFECGAESGSSCWCGVLPRLTSIDPAVPDCLCPECLRSALNHQRPAPT